MNDDNGLINRKVDMLWEIFFQVLEKKYNDISMLPTVVGKRARH